MQHRLAVGSVTCTLTPAALMMAWVTRRWAEPAGASDVASVAGRTNTAIPTQFSDVRTELVGLDGYQPARVVVAL